VATDDALTDFQHVLIEAFFSLPESAGFLLAGGAGLVAAGMSSRPTDDVDLFGSDLDAGVAAAGDALETLSVDRGWQVIRLQDAHTFRRIQIETDDEALLVDLAIDSSPVGTVHMTTVAPTYAPLELAARKLLALFDRAAARDFADVHTLSARFDVDVMIAHAGEVDGGFDLTVFVSMLRTIDRFSDEELAATGSDPEKLRAFFRALAERLRALN
jgi:hypothetical protein